MAKPASAILVSSNPTNLVLAGAFRITFTNYTANMIVPVVITGLALFPFLLYLIFPSEGISPRNASEQTLTSAQTLFLFVSRYGNCLMKKQPWPQPRQTAPPP